MPAKKQPKRPPPPQLGGKMSAETMRSQERRERAIKMRADGASFTEIAAALGISKPAAYQMIRRSMDARERRISTVVDRILRELERIAFADPRSVMTWGPEGATLRDSATLTDDEAAAVAQISQQDVQHGVSMRIKLHDKLRALSVLAQHHGLIKQTVELTGEDGGPIEVADARESLAGKLAGLAARLAAELPQEPQPG